MLNIPAAKQLSLTATLKQIENNISIDKRACDIYENMLNLITDTNKNLLNISTSFQYNSSYKLRNDYSGYPRKVDQL